MSVSSLFGYNGCSVIDSLLVLSLMLFFEEIQSNRAVRLPFSNIISVNWNFFTIFTTFSFLLFSQSMHYLFWNNWRYFHWRNSATAIAPRRNSRRGCSSGRPVLPTTTLLYCLVSSFCCLPLQQGPSLFLATAWSPTTCSSVSPATPRTRTSSRTLFGQSIVNKQANTRRRSSSGEQYETSEEDEQTRWDRLYQRGQERRNWIASLLNNDEDMINGTQQQSTPPLPIRVVTFDLDNTLWKTGPTIDAANDALAEFLTAHKIVQSKRTEDIMKELFRANKTAYCPLLDGDHDAVKVPVLLTQLRQDALRQILIQDNGYSPQDAKAFAQQAFQKWLEARYNAIPSHYSSNVLAVLEHLRQLHLRTDNDNDNRNDSSESATTAPTTTNNKHRILIGAITDGNSDPRNVPALAPFFDFCVNAEQVGVSKPDKRVYLQAAIDHVFSNPSMLHDSDTHTNDDDDDDDDDDDTSSAITAQAAEDRIGPWWIHIGDDFTKDIVAAKNLNMRTVWVRELVMTKETASKKEPSSSSKTLGVGKAENEDLASQYDNNKSSDKSKGVAISDQSVNGNKKNAQNEKKLTPEQELLEFQKRINSQTVVTMAVGAEDYLSVSIQQEFADAVIDSFADLSKVLEDWYDQGLLLQQSPEQRTKGDKLETVVYSLTAQAALPTDENVAAGEIDKDASSVAPETKFCVFCGTKIQRVAVFCSSCGKKQPP